MIKKEQELRRYEKEYKPARAALMKFYPLTLDDLEGEEWKPIPDYDGYQVSNFGRVKSFKQSRVKILKPVINRQGYLLASLSNITNHKSFRVHRLVAQLFVPNPTNKSEVNHRDGNKFNNFVDNLEWVTSSENQQHAVTMGLQKSGVDVYNAKFTNEQILWIRDNPNNLLVSELAKIFNTQTTVISAIQLGKRYKNADGSVRESKPRKAPTFLSDKQKAEIRALYIKGDIEFGATALSKIYGVHADTLRVIVGAKRR